MSRCWLIALEALASLASGEGGSDLELKPEAAEFLAALRASGNPSALITPWLDPARSLLKRLPESRCFTIIIPEAGTLGITRNGFEIAITALGADPAECFAVVSSDAGVLAARAAGVTAVIGVGTMICQAPACQPAILVASLRDAGAMIREAAQS